MAWVATNKDGAETISPQIPERGWRDEWDYSEEVYTEGESASVSLTITVPKGTIYKIIGKKITWENEPVEII